MNPKIQIKAIHHIAISVPSLGAAKAFYGDVLGFELVDQGEIEPSAEGDAVTQLKNMHCDLLMFKAGNIYLEVFEFHEPQPKAQNARPVCDHGYTHFALEVEDIHSAYEYLSNHGVNFHHKPIEADEGYLMTYGRDPFGNVIEIQSLAPGSPVHLQYLNLTRESP